MVNNVKRWKEFCKLEVVTSLIGLIKGTLVFGTIGLDLGTTGVDEGGRGALTCGFFLSWVAKGEEILFWQL